MDEALEYLTKAHLSVLPTLANKRPACKWDHLQKERLEESAALALFSTAEGVGVICGAISGNLECIDFDDPAMFMPWCKQVVTLWGRELLQQLVIHTTPSGGYHVLYRAGAPVDGNAKLAFSRKKNEYGIETRGEGGYFVAPPSPGYALYERSQHTLFSLPVLTESERGVLLSAARSLDETPIKVERRPFMGDEDPVWIRFNRDVSWDSLLTKAGWQQVGKQRGQWLDYVRPGKDSKDGASGGVNKSTDVFRNFSSNSLIPHDKAVDRFGFYAYTWHGGDFSAACKAAIAEGLVPDVRAKSAPQSRQVLDPPQRAAQPKTGGLAVRRLDSFELVEPDFLWEPYLRKGKIGLLDADGGVGKTTMMLAVAAGLSVGVLPNNSGTCEPCKTLYFGEEDEGGELRAIFEANGGDPSMFFCWGADDQKAEPFQFNSEGLARYEQTIKDVGAALVVNDSLMHYLPPRVDMNDGMSVLPILGRLAQIATETGASILNIRHTKKGGGEDGAHHKGLGSVMIRNRHRSQLMLRWHPDPEAFRGVAVLTHEKGSLRTPQGAAMAFQRKGDELLWLTHFELEEDTFDPKKRKERQAGRKGDASAREGWLFSQLQPSGTPKYASIIIEAGERAGWSKSSLYRTADSLGVVKAKAADGSPTWTLPDAFA
jgi:hypothetical protein